MNRIGEIRDKNILLLQGPMGDFFKKLDNYLREEGANTYRIGLNAGDRFFSNRDNYFAYRDTPDNWQNYIKDFLISKKIDKIFLFGDCRFYQHITKIEVQKLDIDLFVFEEGYVRPHYITMEKWGVNDFSKLPRDTNFYKKLPKKPIPKPKHAKSSKFKMVYSATIYYLLANLFKYRYPYYQHHREMSAIKEFFYGVRGAVRKVLFKYLYEHNTKELISTRLSKKYYFVPLQTHTDFQILTHSDFQSIEKFIITVLESFAKNAPKNRFIIFKHHPVDRGRKNYRAFILEQAKILNIQKRVFVFYDTYLPTCLQNAVGTVTVNSTVGLTSIGYNIPTITLGRAVYDIDGLTNKNLTLDEFWSNCKKPDKDLYQKFLYYIIENTQLNGSFYGLFPKM